MLGRGRVEGQAEASPHRESRVAVLRQAGGPRVNNGLSLPLSLSLVLPFSRILWGSRRKHFDPCNRSWSRRGVKKSWPRNARCVSGSLISRPVPSDWLGLNSLIYSLYPLFIPVPVYVDSSTVESGLLVRIQIKFFFFIRISSSLIKS